MEIIKGDIKYLEELVHLEHNCFPKKEICPRKKLKERLRSYPSHFYLIKENNAIIAYSCGFCCDDEKFSSAHFLSTKMHSEKEKNFFLLSLCCLKPFRKKGYASLLLKTIREEMAEKESILLLCKKDKISFYEKFDYKKDGHLIKNSDDWYEMRLNLKGAQK